MLGGKQVERGGEGLHRLPRPHERVALAYLAEGGADALRGGRGRSVGPFPRALVLQLEEGYFQRYGAEGALRLAVGDGAARLQPHVDLRRVEAEAYGFAVDVLAGRQVEYLPRLPAIQPCGLVDAERLHGERQLHLLDVMVVHIDVAEGGHVDALPARGREVL